MDAALPRATTLSATDRQRVESWLTDFERTWREDRLAERVENLPPPGDALRRPALLGMIRIDLRRRWAQGRKALLEAYSELYPELGPAGDAPVDLIETELDARRAAGDAPTGDEIARRFPRRAEELRRWLDASASEEVGRTQNTAVLDDATRTPSPVGKRTAEAPDLPEQFGRYRILRRLGRGGMGSVYLAHDSRLDRQVALKVPQLAAGDAPEVLERFLREARAAALIDHPNVCPVYDVGDHDGVHFVTMAYIEGRSLSELVQGDKPLPQRPVADLVRKLALGLAEAHRRGVVHRDVKPANVMVNARHEPILVDFGLARRVEGDAQLTRTGAVVGTPTYMAPEQVRGDAAAVGPRSDVYSLGVVLYELLAGRPPFQGPSIVVMAQILTQEPEPPATFRPDLDSALAAICQKAMAKAPDDRYDAMDDLAAALDAYLNGDASPLSAASGATVVVPAATEVEGMATRLLARLAERLDAFPAPPPVPPRRRFPWYTAPLAAGVVGAAAVGIVLYFMIPARNPDAVATIPVVKEDKRIRPVEGANDRPAPEAPKVAAVSLENHPPQTPERKPETPPAPAPAAPVGVAVPIAAPDRKPDDAPPAAPTPEILALIDKLGEADGEVRFKAAEELRQKKDLAAVPALIDRVADDLWAAPQDSARWPNSSKMAALKALHELAPGHVTEALVRALGSAHSEEVRSWACEELGNQKEREVADGLAAALAKDASVKVRVAAARALGGVRPSNTAALVEALQDEDDRVRCRAAVSLQQLGDRTKASAKEGREAAAAATPALIARVADDLWSNYDANRDGGKRAALAALRDLAPGRAAEALLLAVRSAHVEEVRAWACQELGNQKDKEAAEALVGVLAKEPSAVVRAAAARGLGTVRPPNAAALVQALQDENKGVRVRAAESLGQLADRTKIPPKEVASVVDGATEALVQGVADDRWSDLHPYIDSSKQAELTTLRELAPGRVTEALVLALRSAQVEDGRAWACEELGKQKDQEAAEALSAALSADPSPTVREAAAAALKKRP